MGIMLSDQFLDSEAATDGLLCRLFIAILKRCGVKGEADIVSRAASQLLGTTEDRLREALLELEHLGFLYVSGQKLISVKVVDHETYLASKASTSVPLDKEFYKSLTEALTWWNDLHQRKLVHSGVRVDPPSSASINAWKRVLKTKSLRDCYDQRLRVEEQLETNAFIRQASWLRFERLFGKNKDHVWIIQKIIEGGYDNGEQGRGRQQLMFATAGQGSDASSGRVF